VPVQFLCEDLDLAGQLGVGFELQFLSFKVVVGLGLLEGGLGFWPIMTNVERKIASAIHTAKGSRESRRSSSSLRMR
jgi:hypothetical protein